MILKKPKFWDKKSNSFLSIILYPISLIYLIISKINIFISTKKFEIPIICVGNIYLGGTGKTPLVKELFKILKNLNKQPGIVKKKYDYLEDEINLLKSYCEVYAFTNRKIGIKKLIEDKKNIAILDDGFQDKSIFTDFRILCFNEKQWIGNGQVMPAGPLRETLSGVSRSDCVIINGKKDINKNKLLLKLNPSLKIFYSNYDLNEKEKFIGKKVTAFAGIGNPSNFFDLLGQNNVNIIKSYTYSDHHKYSNKQIEDIINFAENNKSIVVTSEKDYFRLNEKFRSKIIPAKISLIIENFQDFEIFLKQKIL